MYLELLELKRKCFFSWESSSGSTKVEDCGQFSLLQSVLW